MFENLRKANKVRGDGSGWKPFFLSLLQRNHYTGK